MPPNGPGNVTPNGGPSNMVRESAHDSAKHKMSEKLAKTKHKNHQKHAPTKGGKLGGHLVAALGEFVGTFMFLFYAFAWHQVVGNDTNPSKTADGMNTSQAVIFISIGYGFSLLINVWCFFRVSGGLFNPAVLLALVITKAVPATRGLFLFPAEIIGGIAASAVVSGLFPYGIASVNTSLSPNTSIVQGLFIEMFLTSLLVFTILCLAVEKSKVTFMAPVGIGLALFVAELAGVFYTGGSLNPTRSFGPAVISRSFEGYHWIYWIGPGLGALLASGYYYLIKWLNNGDFEAANPDQDSSGGDFKD